MQKLNIKNNSALAAPFILLIGYILDNVYMLGEILLSSSEMGANYSFIPKWIIPDVLGMLVEWLVLYVCVQRSLKKGTLKLTTNKQLIGFGSLLFLVRITAGRLFFLISYYGLTPFIFGDNRPFGTLSEFASTILINGFLLLATLISFTLSRFAYRLILRRLSHSQCIIKEHKAEKADMFLYALVSAIVALTLVYIVAINEENPMHISTDIALHVGTQLASNTLLCVFLIIPYIIAIFVIGDRKIRGQSWSFVACGTAAGILSTLFTYSLTNYLFLESLGYHGLLFTAGSLVCVYQIGFFLCTFIIRIIFKKRMVNRSLFHVLILIILPSFFGLTVQAQEKKVSWDDYIYTSAWGYLYSDASERSQRLGVFATHAAIIVLDSTTSYYHVMVSNGDIGFIERQPLVGRLFASKYYGEPSEYFYRGKEGFQSPHRYVQVSELRVRSGPSTECNVVGKVAINEMAFFDYWPLYEDGWVYFGDTRHREPKYIQAKYLGVELKYEDVWQAYKAVEGKDLQRELIFVGRLREIAWKNNHKHLPQTLRLYEEVYHRAGQKNPRIDIEQELLLAEQIGLKPDHSTYLQEWIRLDAHYRIRGTILHDGRISDRQAQQIGLKYAKSIPDAPECGWEPLHFYLDKDVVLAFEKYNEEKIAGSVFSLALTKDNAWIVGKEIIDCAYAENDFIRKFGRFIDVDRVFAPHVYRIMLGDAGFYQITFENGRPIFFQCFFYC